MYLIIKILSLVIILVYLIDITIFSFLKTNEKQLYINIIENSFKYINKYIQYRGL